MAFTNEQTVRDVFGLADTESYPSAQIIGAIDMAAIAITRRLAPDAPVSPPDAALVLGETILAGAVLYRGFAGGEARLMQSISLGGNSRNEGRRFDALLRMVGLLEDYAWQLLSPFVAATPDQATILATESQPILGKE